MALEDDLISAVQAFDRLMTLQNPDLIQYWRPPPELKAEYVQLAETVVYALDALKSVETRGLHESAEVESKLPHDVLITLREKIRQKEASLWDALDILDPDNKMFREIMVFQTRPAGRGGGVRSTFEQGVEQVHQLIENNDDIDFSWLHPDLAQEVLDSKLIAFEPDAWLDRIAELAPIRTGAQKAAIPAEVRLRLRELFQVYAFGCWFSALSAARATLEYALQQNASKYRIETLVPSRSGDRTASLYQIIEAYALALPELQTPMHRIRILGNLSLHPSVTGQESPGSVLRAQHAAEAIALLVEVLERLYLPQ